MFLFWILSLALSAKRSSHKGKKKQTFDDNVLYVTEQNMSLAFEDLPAVFLLVQLGSDKDGRFRTKADFIAAASNLGSRCYFAIMDGDRNMKFVRSTNQRDAKSYFFYRYGQLVGRYSGGPTTEEITNFAMSRTGIPFTTFDDYTIAQDFIESNNGAVVLYLEKAGGPLFEKYNQWAEKLRDNTTFGLCPDPDIADELDISEFPSLVLYRHTDHSKAVYADDLNDASLTDITEWINYNKKPKFEPFQINKQSVYHDGKPLLLFFTPVEEEAKKSAISVITNLANSFGNEFKVVSIDAVTGNRFMTEIGFGRYADPAVAILVYSKLGKLTKYLHDEEDPFTEDHIGNFIEMYIQKKLKPNIRSAKLPDENDGPLFEVNALTFNDTVMNTDQSVVVLYYEDWDRLYTEFLPEFTELAETFANNSISKVKFVKFNIAANDLLVGPDPKKTPSVYLFASGLKKKPILYTKKLNKKGVADFIYEELDVKVEL
ncbi:hypothetical protein TRFO_02072 [Tritrichomonas foetus]|uniref:protein disulfide-isomerase n=1 Tax=Tritrichomonas foetus TaxID=1144522 RepID=A0A1J4JE62_9EUKA|nr:hypothetical protein TRFO_02072 [Tritrichomonas foetus]|eukprot:OHS96937.1 hypothetical protein TRFO_02072 [Tritrichomonas foetus]